MMCIAKKNKSTYFKKWFIASSDDFPLGWVAFIPRNMISVCDVTVQHP